MCQTDSRPPRLNSRTRWVVWLVYFCAWTTGLLMPIPWHVSWEIEGLELDLKFFATKGLHVLAYSLLAILTGWLAAPVRWRWLLMFILMAHASVTELIQLWVPGRTGSLRDVLFDHGGIALGLLVSWRRWTASAAERGEQHRCPAEDPTKV